MTPTRRYHHAASTLLWLSVLLLLSLTPVQAAAVRGSDSPSLDTLAENAPHSSTSTRQQRQRRAMDNNRQGYYERQRRYQGRTQKYYMQTESEESEDEKRSEQADATLADVWLCYAFALGWSMWFLSSFLNTDLMRFAESESVLVHGNVREVSIEDDQDGSGVPQYFAIIDYFITVKRERDASRIQVRKAFQTQHLLQQGFANVELLVLPEEPTSSVLKEDWQREVAAQEQAEEDIISLGGFGDMGTSLAGFGDMGTVVGIQNGVCNDGSGSDTKANEKKASRRMMTLSRVDVWAKRTSLVLSGVLVTASLIAAVQTVHRIPREPMQSLGWVSVTLGSVLLWPLALFCLRIVSTCQRLSEMNTERSGIILKCDTNAQIGAINEEKIYTQHMGTGRHVDRVTHPGVFEQLKKLDESGNNNNDSSMIDTTEGEDSNNQSSLLDGNISADESACYFVKLPGQKDETGLGMVRLDDSSMSTISANSNVSKTPKRISTSSV